MIGRCTVHLVPPPVVVLCLPMPMWQTKRGDFSGMTSIQLKSSFHYHRWVDGFCSDASWLLSLSIQIQQRRMLQGLPREVRVISWIDWGSCFWFCRCHCCIAACSPNVTFEYYGLGAGAEGVAQLGGTSSRHARESFCYKQRVEWICESAKKWHQSRETYSSHFVRYSTCLIFEIERPNTTSDINEYLVVSYQYGHFLLVWPLSALGSETLLWPDCVPLSSQRDR